MNWHLRNLYNMQTTDGSVINDRSRSKINLLGIGILLLITAAFFYPMLFDGKVIFYRDYNLITYPIRYFLGQSFNQWAIPFWVPYANGGMPFMATFHPGVFYPPSLLFLLDDTTYALNLFYVLHFVILGVFTFLLARSWKISFVAALCSAVTAMLSGYIVASTLISNYFISAVWLPLVFWMFHRFWTRKHVGYFIGLVLAIATQTLAACPEINVMTMCLLYAHSLYFLPRAPGFPGIARMTAALALAVALALGLSALQLVPTAKLLKHSFRDGGLSYEDHTRWSMDQKELLSLVISPDYEGYFDRPLRHPPAAETKDKVLSGLETGSEASSNSTLQTAPPQTSRLLYTMYLGLIALVFVFFGFLVRREKVMGFWLVVFLFGLFFAFGKYNPVYKVFYFLIPILNLFRYPEKYTYLSAFAAVFMTGYGLDSLIRYTRERRIKIYPVLTIVIILFGVIGLGTLDKSHFNPVFSMGLLAVFGFVYILYYFGKMKEGVFAVMVLAVILLDLSVKGIKLLPLIDRKYYEEKPVLLEQLDEAYGKYRIYSGNLNKQPQPLSYPLGPTRLSQILASKQHLIPYAGMVYQLEHVNGITGLALTLKNNIMWGQIFTKSPAERRRRILARSNTRYWIDGETLTHYLEDYPVILPNRLKVLDGTLPRAYLVPRMKVPTEDGHLLNTYYKESFDPLKEVLFYEAVDFEESPHFKGTVENVEYRPNHATVKTFQEGNGFLVLMDSYFPGWTVKVDGEKQPVLQANHFYRAVQLGPGRHTLEFDYVPEGFRVGLTISGVCVFLIILMGLFSGKYVRKIV